MALSSSPFSCHIVEADDEKKRKIRQTRSDNYFRNDCSSHFLALFAYIFSRNCFAVLSDPRIDDRSENHFGLFFFLFTFIFHIFCLLLCGCCDWRTLKIEFYNGTTIAIRKCLRFHSTFSDSDCIEPCVLLTDEEADDDDEEVEEEDFNGKFGKERRKFRKPLVKRFVRGVTCREVN